MKKKSNFWKMIDKIDGETIKMIKNSPSGRKKEALALVKKNSREFKEKINKGG